MAARDELDRIAFGIGHKNTAPANPAELLDGESDILFGKECAKFVLADVVHGEREVVER